MGPGPRIIGTPTGTSWTLRSWTSRNVGPPPPPPLMADLSRAHASRCAAGVKQPHWTLRGYLLPQCGKQGTL